MTQVMLPSYGPTGGPGFRSLFDANRSSDAPAGLQALFGAQTAGGLPEQAERLLRDTQRLFDDSRERADDGAAVVDAPTENVSRGIGSVFDIGDIIDKVGNVLSGLAKQLFGDFDPSNLLKGLQDQIRNVLTAPFDGRGTNVSTAGSAFASFQGVEITFETDGSHTSLHVKQTSVQTAYGYGATADGSLAYRLGSYSSETNELDVDLFARGDGTEVKALFQHTSLDVVAVQAVQRGPVAIGSAGDASAGPQTSRGSRRDSIVDRFLDLLDPTLRVGGGNDGPRTFLPGDKPGRPRALIVIDVPKSKVPVLEGGRLRLSLDMLLPIDLRVPEETERVQNKADAAAASAKAAQSKAADTGLDIKV